MKCITLSKAKSMYHASLDELYAKGTIKFPAALLEWTYPDAFKTGFNVFLDTIKDDYKIEINQGRVK